MSSSDSYELVVEFDRQEPDFARGVQIGMLYQRLISDPPPVAATIHADNAEMALRLADSLHLSVTAEELGGDWLEVTYGAS